MLPRYIVKIGVYRDTLLSHFLDFFFSVFKSDFDLLFLNSPKDNHIFSPFSILYSGNVISYIARDKYFLIFPRKHMLWYSLEAPPWGASNEYPRHMFSWKKYQYTCTLCLKSYHQREVKVCMFDLRTSQTCFNNVRLRPFWVACSIKSDGLEVFTQNRCDNILTPFCVCSKVLFFLCSDQNLKPIC